jgi:hypothetical protein
MLAAEVQPPLNLCIFSMQLCEKTEAKWQQSSQ